MKNEDYEEIINIGEVTKFPNFQRIDKNLEQILGFQEKYRKEMNSIINENYENNYEKGMNQIIENDFKTVSPSLKAQKNAILVNKLKKNYQPNYEDLYNFTLNKLKTLTKHYQILKKEKKSEHKEKWTHENYVEFKNKMESEHKKKKSEHAKYYKHINYKKKKHMGPIETCKLCLKNHN